jgi:hypothetical protein
MDHGQVFMAIPIPPNTAGKSPLAKIITTVRLPPFRPARFAAPRFYHTVNFASDGVATDLTLFESLPVCPGLK